MSATLAPQERDALVSELRRRTTTPGFHHLTPDHLQRLNAAASDDAPVVSLFMELTPEMRMAGTWETALKDLRDRALAHSGARGQETAVRAELDRIEAALRGGLPRTGRGVAFFACEPIGLFEQIGTAVALPGEVHVNRSPYVRPLARVRDEHDRFVIALVSTAKCRFFFAQIGLVEEVFGFEEEVPGLTDFATKDQRQDIRGEHRRAMAQRSAHALDLIVERLGARHVIYAVPPDMEAGFLDALPQATRGRVAAAFACDINASAPEVAEKAAPVQQEVEAREELETIARIRELLPTRAVTGLDATLDMLNQQRVMTLVVDDAARVAGGVEPQSGMLTTQTDGAYAATGDPIHPEPDLIEVMLERAMAQGATLELVRSDAAKAALAEYGPSAALLRF